jgi:biotin carboxyl carrier protein
VLLTIRQGEALTTADVQSDGRVVIDGVSYETTRVSPGILMVSDGSSRWTVAVTGPPDNRWISVDGRAMRVEVEAAGGSSTTRTRRSAHGAMMAPMPASVVKVLVSVGQPVEAGELVVVLEAMKMELSIRAQRAGTVTAINCAAGELVQPGVDLVEIA